MKVTLNWFSPTDPKATDIAHHSQMLMPWLIKRCHVSNAPQFLSGENLTEYVKPDVDDDDIPVNIYHLGNSKMHCNIYDRLLNDPGLVVLHEVNLVDLAQNYAEIHGNYESWRDTMHSQYGDEVMELAIKSEKWEESSARVELAMNYPLFKPFIEKAVGIIVHTEYAERVLRSTMPADLPIKHINLPYPPGGEPAERDYDASVLRFVFCGHVGENRRIKEFMQAWGRLSDPSRIRFDIYGHVSMREELNARAEELGIADYLNIHGFVERGVLIEALENAHFGVNLRWPTMGETSSCSLLFWSHALPTITSDIGWSADLPNDVIMKIPIEHEVESLASLLESIISDPGKYADYGRAGREYLKENHTYEKYVAQLLEFVSDNTEACQQALCDLKADFGARMLEDEFADVLASMSEDYNTLELFTSSIDTASRLFGTDDHVN